MTKRRLTATFAVLAGFSLVSGHGSADTKDYPGIVCVERPDPHPDVDGTYTISGGAVLNASTSDQLELHCPLVQDSLILGGEVSILDRHDNHLVNCGALSVLEDDGALFVEQTAFGGFNGSSLDPTIEAFSLAPGDYTFILCFIPQVEPVTGRRSGISAIRIHEL